MKLRINLFFLALLLIAACSPKTTPPTEETTSTEESEPIKQEPENPCITFKNLSGSEKDQVETAYVLYRDQVKAGNLDAAFPIWKKAYYGAPAANGRVKYQFDDGVKIYTHLYMNETDSLKKIALADSVMAVYDKRIECFGDAAYVQGRKAFDYYYTFQGMKTDEEIFDLFAKNIDAKGKKADYFIINPFSKILADRVIFEDIDYEEGRKYAKKLREAIKYGTANCKGNICDAWETINSYAPERLETLEGVDGFYDCEYYSEKYYPMFQESPDDCDIVNLVFRRLQRGACPLDDPKMIEVANIKEQNCKVVVEAGPLRKGYDAYNEGKYREAVNFFEEFVNSTSDLEKKAKYTLLIAKVYYGDLKNYPQSRKYAIQAASYKANWGEPYILIGKLYASSGPLCGPGRGWDSQVVTWPAIDKFRYAKSIDPSVAAEANKWISQYTKYMPSREDIFQRRLSEGDSFRVGCWIQENTTVRTAN